MKDHFDDDELLILGETFEIVVVGSSMNWCSLVAYFYYKVAEQEKPKNYWQNYGQYPNLSKIDQLGSQHSILVSTLHLSLVTRGSQ